MLGPTDGGSAWLLGGHRLDEAMTAELPWANAEVAATVRVRCTRNGVVLHDLGTAPVVEEPSDVLALLEELRRHPERAPRTAHYVVTRG